MMNEAQPWPTRITREQRRAMKLREKEFQISLKTAARNSGWRYSGGEIFRQDGDWFASAFPCLRWERGATLRFLLKPMALDPLFWDIVGLPENRHLPLSFRANGAWVLRPPQKEKGVGLTVSDAPRLAEMIVEAVDDELCRSRTKRSIEKLQAELDASDSLKGHRLAVAICLHALKGDLDQALKLCRDSRADNGPNDGGFSTISPDGSFSTFVDQAEDWIFAKRRSHFALV